MVVVCFDCWALGSQNTNAHDAYPTLSFNSFASSFHRWRGQLTFHADGQFYSGCSRLWPVGGWDGGTQPTRCSELSLETLFFLRGHTLLTCASVSKPFLFFFSFSNFILYVFTKAHSFSVIKHTLLPVKTIRATGLEKVRTAPRGTRRQFQMILHWVCRDSARAEGQTLTIINGVPMELYAPPPAYGAQQSNRRVAPRAP